MMKPFQIIELLDLGIFPNAYGSDSPECKCCKCRNAGVSVITSLELLLTHFGVVVLV